MIICGFKYEAGYMDYMLFEMYNLNSKQRKILDNWMNERSKSFPEITNWILISRLWSIGNGDKYVPKNPIQPNYTDLINMKG